MRVHSAVASLTVTAAILVFNPWAVCFRAQSTDPGEAFRRRLEVLEQQVRTIQSAIDDRAPKPDGNGGAPSLKDRLDEVSLQIKVLARQIELDKEQAAERARQAPVSTAGREGFLLRSSDGSFRLRLRGYLQSDGRFFLDDPGARVTDTFLLRRVRPIVESTVYGLFDFRIMPDFGDGRTSLQDAYVEARFRPSLKLRAGKFKTPFGIERLMSATELPFIERALPTALVPNRDIGVMLHGDVLDGTLNYAGGLFNGVPDGGSADADAQDGKDVAGRLFAQPFRGRTGRVWQGLGIGLAGSYGTERGSTAVPSLPSFRSAGQQTFFAFRGADPSTGPGVADGRHARVSVQGHYYAGPAGVLAEHVISSGRVRRGTSAASLRHTAWQVAGSYVLTGETPSYRGVSPRTRFDPANGTWGAVELTTRYSTLVIDGEAFPAFANPAISVRAARAWAAGVNWYLNSAVKLAANYELTRFDGGAFSANRPAEHGVLTRMQIAF